MGIFSGKSGRYSSGWRSQSINLTFPFTGKSIERRRRRLRRRCCFFDHINQGCESGGVGSETFGVLEFLGGGKTNINSRGLCRAKIHQLQLLNTFSRSETVLVEDVRRWEIFINRVLVTSQFVGIVTKRESFPDITLVKWKRLGLNSSFSCGKGWKYPCTLARQWTDLTGIKILKEEVFLRFRSGLYLLRDPRTWQTQLLFVETGRSSRRYEGALSVRR